MNPRYFYRYLAATGAMLGIACTALVATTGAKAPSFVRVGQTLASGSGNPGMLAGVVRDIWGLPEDTGSTESEPLAVAAGVSRAVWEEPELSIEEDAFIAVMAAYVDETAGIAQDAVQQEESAVEEETQAAEKKQETKKESEKKAEKKKSKKKAAGVYTIPSVEIEAYSGEMVWTDELTVDVDALKAAYATEKTPEWDEKGTFPTTNTIYHFLVDQMGVSSSIASGMCGNFYAEGTFGMEQSTYHIFTSYKDAKKRLGGDKDTGYGFVQWTVACRRQNLLNYYTAVYQTLKNEDFETVMMVAELCCMYEEVLYMRDIFDDMTADLSIEDATGHISLLFEAYKDCEEDWKKTSSGKVKLLREKSAGARRVRYATNIYNYYNK